MTTNAPFVPIDGTFRGLTQSLLDIWQERNPENALRTIQNHLLNELTTRIVLAHPGFADSTTDHPVSAAISLYDEKRNRLRIECAVGPLAADMLANPPRQSGITAHVYQYRRPLIVPRIEQWPSGVPTLRLGVLDHRQVRSVAMYPLLIGEGAQERAIGVLTIMASQPIENNSQLEAALRAFADRAAFLTQATRVHRRRLREEQALVEISQATANGNPETLSKIIGRQAVTLTKSAYAAVFMVSRDRGELNSMGLAVAQGLLPRSSSIRLDLTKTSINSLVYRTQRSYYAPDLADDPHYFHYAKWDEETGSAYCVPLQMREVTVGTLYVASRSRHGFTKQDQDFIDQLAFHAASALRSTSLLQNVVRFQQIISDVLPVAEQFSRIRDELEQLGFDTSGLMIASYNADTQRGDSGSISFPYVWSHNQLVADHNPLRQPGGRYSARPFTAGYGLVDWVIHHQSSLLIKDFSQWSSTQQFDLDEYGDLTCCLFVPMFRQERIVGVLGLRGFLEANLFDEYDQQFLEVVANHIAIIIENAATYSRDVRQLDLLQTVRMLQEHIADMLPVPQQMTQIRVALQRLGINTSGLFIATVDAETQLIELPKVYDRGTIVPPEVKAGDSPFAPRKVGKRRGLIDWCILNGSGPIRVADFHEWAHRHHIEHAYAEGIACFMMAPMYHSKKLIGVIGLRGYERPHMFDDSHLELLTAIADFMAIVVENAQIYDRAQSELQASNRRLQRQLEVWKALSDFQREISDISTREKEIENIWACLRQALEEIKVDPGSLYLALLQDGQITFPRVFEQGRPVLRSPESPDHPYHNRRLGTRPDLTEWVLKHGKIQHFRSRQEMIAFQEIQADLLHIPQFSLSWLGVPIKKGTVTYGMIGLRSFEHENAFDQPLEEFMTAIASQVAIVFDNAQLFENIQYEASTANALAAAGRIIASAGLETNRVLQTILQQAVEVTGARVGTLQLVKDGALAVVAVWPEADQAQVFRQIGRIPIDGPGITARAARENDAQLVVNVGHNPDYYSILPGIRSELAVALRSVGERAGTNGYGGEPGERNKEVIGVINVEHEKIGGLTTRHRRLLIDLSNSASVAIDYADQYQALERARDMGLASTAIAWLGLFGADWQHTINQKTFSISNYVTGLKLHLQKMEEVVQNGIKNEVNDEVKGDSQHGFSDVAATIERLRNGLMGIQSVADEIREVKFTRQVQLPSSLTEGLSVGDRYDMAISSSSGSCEVDREVPQMVNSWCRRRRDIQIAFRLAAPHIQVGIASQWLKVALEKLINNALEVMPDGGTLTICTDCDGANLTISIHDTGPGVPESLKASFLKRAIPKRDGEQGSGMGAMIARFVALSHGGDLHLIDNGPGQGTELLMSLPIIKPILLPMTEPSVEIL